MELRYWALIALGVVVVLCSLTYSRSQLPGASIPWSNIPSWVWWTITVIGVIGSPALIKTIFPGALASTPPGNNSSASSPAASKPNPLEPVVAEVQTELAKAGKFFPRSWEEKVPLPLFGPKPSEPEVTYLTIPPTTETTISWPDGSGQHTWENYVTVNRQRVGAHLVYPASQIGTVLQFEGHYMRPERLKEVRSGNMSIAMRPNQHIGVVATAFGSKPGTVAPPGYWLWGKLPPRAVEWKCVIRFADSKGKPVAKDHPPPIFAESVSNGLKGKVYVPSWDKHIPAGDKSAAVFTTADIPSERDYLVIHTKEPLQITVDIVLGP